MRSVGGIAGLIFKTLHDALIAILIALLLAAMIGQFSNDSVKSLIPLMYLPVPLLAPAALILDVIRRGRTLRGIRFSLTVLVVLSLAIEFPRLFGTGSFDPPAAGAQTVRVLQWNVMWGGGWGNPSKWDDISRKVVGRQPDIVVLSEVPLDERKSTELLHQLGPTWHAAAFDHYGHAEYVSRIRVMSRFPVIIESRDQCSDGTYAIVSIQTPAPVRMMIVDGISGLQDKTKLLTFVTDAMNADGNIDIVTGDFNATSRSRGFSRLVSHGYRDANAHNVTYRPGWPAIMPIFDIDHLFVADRHRILNCRSFRSRGSDHRGQYADLQFNAR